MCREQSCGFVRLFGDFISHLPITHMAPRPAFPTLVLAEGQRSRITSVESVRDYQKRWYRTESRARRAASRSVSQPW